MVNIQTAGLRDFSGLRHIERMCFPHDAWPLIDLIAVLSLPGVVRLKAEVDGCMVGFIAGEQRPSQGVAWIATLGVLPEHQRKGIARALLEECEERLIADVIRLCVRLYNTAAIRLYESSGYLRLETWSRYYRDGGDALVMEKKNNTRRGE